MSVFVWTAGKTHIPENIQPIDWGVNHSLDGWKGTKFETLKYLKSTYWFGKRWTSTGPLVSIYWRKGQWAVSQMQKGLPAALLITPAKLVMNTLNDFSARSGSQQRVNEDVSTPLSWTTLPFSALPTMAFVFHPLFFSILSTPSLRGNRTSFKCFT